jgi:hypothetical protein
MASPPKLVGSTPRTSRAVESTREKSLRIATPPALREEGGSGVVYADVVRVEAGFKKAPSPDFAPV